MTIDDLMFNNQIDDIYYSKDFITLIESNLQLLRTTNIRIQTITDQQAYKFEGDFYGLLLELNIPRHLHFVVLRVNNYRNSSDYMGDLQNIIIPDQQLIIELVNVLMTKYENI